MGSEQTSNKGAKIHRGGFSDLDKKIPEDLEWYDDKECGQRVYFFLWQGAVISHATNTASYTSSTPGVILTNTIMPSVATVIQAPSSHTSYTTTTELWVAWRNGTKNKIVFSGQPPFKGGDEIYVIACNVSKDGITAPEQAFPMAARYLNWPEWGMQAVDTNLNTFYINYIYKTSNRTEESAVFAGCATTVGVFILLLVLGVLASIVLPHLKADAFWAILILLGPIVSGFVASSRATARNEKWAAWEKGKRERTGQAFENHALEVCRSLK